jgi:hypothetical protein
VTTRKVNIEIMVDTNANSRKMDGEYESIRELVEHQDAGQNRAIREFRAYMREARVRGIDYDVVQRDTAQLFHEKTHLMTPELAKEAGHEIWPDFLRENLEQGHYHVEPPIHGEEKYYDALQTFLARILPEKAPEDVAKLESITPENRGLVLQDLYLTHMTDLSGKFRNGKYKKDFEEYRETRFNAGEITAVNFLRNHDLPPEGERTAFVFVGSDKWANEQMQKARKHLRREDKDRFEVFVAEPQQFRGLMEHVIRDIEKDNPEMRDLRRSSFRELAYIDGDLMPSAVVDSQQGELGKQAAQQVRMPKAPISDEARAFTSFVTRLQQEDRDGGISR